MTWSRVQEVVGNNGATATGNVSVAYAATTQGNLLLFGILLTTPGTITMPLGWTLLASVNLTGGGVLAVYAMQNCAAGITVVNALFPSSLAAALAYEYTGGPNSFIPLDEIVSTANAVGTAVNSGNTNSLTQTVGALAVAFIGITQGVTDITSSGGTSGFSQQTSSKGTATASNPKIITYDNLSFNGSVGAFSSTLSLTPSSGPAVILGTFFTYVPTNGYTGPAYYLG